MVKVEILTLLEQAVNEHGPDAVLRVVEQPIGDPVRYRASFDGDLVVGEGDTPHQAISDYTAKAISGKVTHKDAAGRTLDITLSADGKTANLLYNPK